MGEKIFKAPSDQVCFIVDYSTAVVIRVERQLLPNEGGFFDIVDIILKRPLLREDDNIQVTLGE